MSDLKTNAVIFPEANKFAITELQLEPPGPTDIIVRTLVSAISPGTERWILRGKHVGTTFPCAPGYHRIGIVEYCGPDVNRFQVGDVVYGSANRWKGDIASMWGAHVGLSVGEQAEYRFLSSTLPAQVELEALSFTVLASVAHRGIRFCEVKSRQRLLIIGAGFLGLCAAQFAIYRGAEVVLLDLDDNRIALAKQFTPHAFRSDDPEMEEKLRAIAPDGFDLLYDTVGHAETTDQLVPLVRQQGSLLLQAQYFDRQHCAINLDQIKQRELTMKTTCGCDGLDLAETTAAIRQRIVQVTPTITHRFEAKDALQGFEILHTGQPFNMGIVLRWDERVRD